MRIHTTLRRCILLLSAIFSLLLTTGCEHRQLSDPANKHFMRIYLDENIKNVTHGFYNEAHSEYEIEYSTPRVLRVALYDPATGKQTALGYLQKTGSDERGNYVEGYISASEGEYNMLISKFDCISTHLRDENVYDQVQVYTNPISQSIMNALHSTRDPFEPHNNIVYEPDHFFLESVERIALKNNVQPDTLYNAEGDHFTAESIVYTYYLQVNVKGASRVSSASGYLSGFAGSVNLCDQSLNMNDKASIYFQLKSNHVSSRSDITQAYAVFNTFGKLPDAEGVLTAVFEFKAADGSVHVEKMVITHLFETEMAKNNQWIIIDDVIEIEGVSDEGGLDPNVGNWDNIYGEITI